MKSLAQIVAVTAFALAALSAPAKAAIISYEFSGSVINGLDTVGLLGIKNKILDGLSVKLTFLGDTNSPDATLVSGSDFARFDFLSSFNARFSIDGKEYLTPSIDSGSFGKYDYYDQTFGAPLGDTISAGTYTNLGSRDFFIFAQMATSPGFFSNFDPTKEISYFNSNATGDYGTIKQSVLFGGVYYDEFKAELEFSEVKVRHIGSVAAAVPEPGTWTLIISGFIFIGMLLRNRQSINYSIQTCRHEILLPND